MKKNLPIVVCILTLFYAHISLCFFNKLTQKIAAQYHHKHGKGNLTLLVGPMGAGKTNFLIDKIMWYERFMVPTAIFKPKIDNRYTEGHIYSHNHRKVKAICIHSPEDARCFIDKETKMIFFDEMQFFSDDFVPYTQELKNEGKNIFAAGLPEDSNQRPFGIMPELKKIADEIKHLNGYCFCSSCNGKRTAKHTVLKIKHPYKNIKLSQNKEQNPINVGGFEEYDTVCDEELEIRREIERSILIRRTPIYDA